MSQIYLFQEVPTSLTSIFYILYLYLNIQDIFLHLTNEFFTPQMSSSCNDLLKIKMIHIFFISKITIVHYLLRQCL